MTRPYNATPLLEDDGPDLIECPDCEGSGEICIDGWSEWTCDEFGDCPRCDGTGTIDRHDDDGSDAFDSACDEYHERQIDREAGLP